MKKTILFPFLLFCSTLFGQIPTLVLKLDSIPITNFSLKESGNLNFTEHEKLTGKVNVILMKGKRPLFNETFSSISAFNRSTITSKIRNESDTNCRIMIEYIPQKGNVLTKIIPITN